MKIKKARKSAGNRRGENALTWLIFFYSVPSQPVGNRVKIWRRLSKAGAIQLKGSVYILPYNDLHYEFFQWLVSEVTEMHGEAAFLRGEKIETLRESEIIALFNQQREKDYLGIEKDLDGLERIISSFRKGSTSQRTGRFLELFSKLSRTFEEIREIDFFTSQAGKDLKKRIGTAESAMKNLSASAPARETAIKPRNPKEYQGRVWVTRKKPFVDRIASAWLIKESIDRRATFQFIDEEDLENLAGNAIAFDIRGGEFTHVGNMCTFEVLLKSFRIKDRRMKKIAEIVHELDLKDGTFSNPESKGTEEVLIGIRKTARDDREMLEKGMMIFRMIHAAKS